MPLPKKVKVKLKAKNKSSPTQTSSVLDRIRPIGFGDDDGIKLMLYGRSGTGKTTTWGTFPGKTLAILCSGSDTPGELRSIDTAENRERIESVVLRKADELQEITTLLREEPDRYRNVVLDHASGFADLVLRNILNLEEDIVQKTFGMATQQDYGQMSLQFKTYLRPLIGLPQNIVIIAHERTFGEKETDTDSPTEGLEQTVGAALTPSLTNWMNGAMDYLARTFVRQQVIVKWTKVRLGEGKVKKVKNVRTTDKVEYCLRVGGSPTYQTKFRVPGGISESVIVNPTYDKIMALIRGESTVTLQDESTTSEE